MTSSRGTGRGMKQEQLGTYSPEVPRLQVSLIDCRCRASSVGYESMHNARWLRAEYDERLRKHLLRHQ